MFNKLGGLKFIFDNKWRVICVFLLNGKKTLEFVFDKLLFQSKGIKDEEKLKKVFSFLRHRWQSNNNIISEKDIEDAIEIYK